MAPWGGIFDFNFDGKTSWDEQALGFMIINECMKEDSDDDDSSFVGSGIFSSGVDHSWRSLYDYDLETGIDPNDYETEDEYQEALNSAKYAWRDYHFLDIETGIDPEDYETEEEFEEALAEAQGVWKEKYRYNPAITLDPDDFETEEEFQSALSGADAEGSADGSISIPIKLSVSVSYPGQETLEAIKRDAYPDDRSYEAARYMCDLEQGTAWILEDTDVEAEKERCRFILDRPCLAAHYLTPYNGFILAQAVRDHFTLPIEVAPEDTESKLSLDDLISEVAEEDSALALDIWVWCIKEFGPHQKYLRHKWSLYGGILGRLDEYPEEFRQLVVKKLGTDTDFAKGVLTDNPDIPYGIADCITTALENGSFQEAQIMFVATVTNPVLRGKDIEAIINSVLCGISNYEELESMELFQKFMMPIIKKINNKRIQRLVPQFMKTVTDYISSVERTVEKYQYSRRYAWRKTCADGKPYDLDPLDFETEEEYNKAIQDEKYHWRRWHREASRYGLDVNSFETEDEYETALHEKQAIERQERLAQRQASYVDPLASTDKAIYEFCGVSFGNHSHPYHYLTGGVDVSIGDQVEVPSNRPEGVNIGTVVSVSKHLRSSAPYPVDRAKTILRKI
ncbi:MAG: hypothetical protein IJZ68_14245 [Bacteroidaceae bacterium]|nr:hypothetical protein [Bacteroidaceae bacterium]